MLTGEAGGCVRSNAARGSVACRLCLDQGAKEAAAMAGILTKAPDDAGDERGGPQGEPTP